MQVWENIKLLYIQVKKVLVYGYVRKLLHKLLDSDVEIT